MAKTVKDMVAQYDRNRYAFSEFLGLAEQDEMLRQLKDFPGVPYEFYGGVDGAERVVLRVGSPETLGYEESWPISLVEVLAKVYNLSRSAASELFTQGKVFVNGRMLEHGSYELEFGEIVSVRGHGRFWLAEDRGLSRKGKRNLVVLKT